MSLLTYVKAHSWKTKKEWIRALHEFGDQADTTATALKKAKSDRQIDQLHDAKLAHEHVGQALSWLEYDTWPSSIDEDVRAALQHIKIQLETSST